jgi:Transmembrane domain of unknown function (DUF3566)
MTERSAEQAPVETRPQGQESHQDTARIPLAERLQRRIAAADERRANAQSARQSPRVLPPMPAELTQQRTEERSASRAAAQAPAEAPAQPAPPPVPRSTGADPSARAVQAVPDQTAAVPVVPGHAATTSRRTSAKPSRVPRRARLRLSRIDPWSVMKVSFLLSIAFGIVTVVSVFLVWSVLGAAGVWDSINNTVSDTVSSGNNVSTFNIEDYLGMSRVLGFTMLVSVIDVILITAIATLGAFLYNMAASLLGGIEVTLAEDA